MFTHVYQNWHVWESDTHILASDENTKELTCHKSLDDCINWLYLNRSKDAARSLTIAKRLNKNVRSDE